MSEPVWTCAGCGGPVPSHEAGIVVVRVRKSAANPDGVVSVHTHDTTDCRKRARA